MVLCITYMFMETCAECRAKHNSEMKDNKEAGIIDKCMLTEEAGILIAGNISLASVIRTFIKNVIKEPKKLVAIMISPLGIFIYMNYLRYFCGILPRPESVEDTENVSGNRSVV